MKCSNRYIKYLTGLLMMLFSGMHSFAQQPTLSGTWVLQPVLPSDTAAGARPSISFNTGNSSFTGFTGCNDMSGNFKTKDGDLSFAKEIRLSKKICEGYNEKEFVMNLLRVNGYKFQDGILVLLINTTPVSRWTRKEQQAAL
ncbi:META domain-containing protein [Sediminibacterium ginsengisoli]|uniref:Heat shock protein HslJ n=1 Tax=Sediminibacterium ginsengisoli TaxID=413434 RepID=A0A1T4RAR8_9BACT|nr:META domain-containing protein [Sediminibacterium ginsengisoli]SKA13132.1 Heat shock protein HslJ [Sediminibacterium ginsengisoli]